ncbi:uncharacterized protein N0V89_005151 [Didymosphaeria variabile]|uniref:NmrA-like domain-containing protein n=1 Tax=Didymosphaeria variabile TaxID=1932322 RepID=A0A9W9CAY2_9PLEO|nr:uncharacterized protein N0V89_005151 [Didymosphaeria variabile]KAJ4353422.1 hypothetical protein N0V89_005151 [Didymosphaeria variabile]
MSSSKISKVAIVGAGGNVGSFIASALLKTGKHTITAITRTDSQSKLPNGVSVAQVDYSSHSSLVYALKGHDALVITLSGHAAIQEIEEKLVRAAGEAGVPWILPNEWSPDTAHEELVRDVPMFQPKVATRKTIEKLGQSSFISVVTGFWYEYTLANPGAYGFDLNNQAVTLFDEGKTKVSTSTWPQIGRAVAALLSLPIESETEACLDNFRNKVVYVSSFSVDQEDMFASVLRVTGSKRDGWTVTNEDAQGRFDTGFKEMKEGKWSGFGKVMYTRVFFPDGCGDFEHGKGTLNRLLGLPQEDIDEATKIAVERAKSPKTH